MGNFISQPEFVPIPLDDLQTKSDQVSQQMIENGFVVFSFREDLYDTIENMYTAGSAFLAQDKATKNAHEDPKNENMGYVDVEGTRDFIKLRADGDRQKKFPEHPQNFREVFAATHALLADTAWKIYLQLLRNKLVQQDPEAFPPDVLESLKSCLNEFASTSYIRYYIPPVSDTTGQPASQFRDVCDAHTDTGLLTLILCSKIPGLQVWDRKNNKWLEIEKHLIEKYKKNNPKQHLVLCIVGEKIGTFTASTALTATRHQVMVQNGVERTSLLYFMDTAK